MYSVVLMAALSGAPAVPDTCFHRCHCSCGCNCGCWCGCSCGCWCGCSCGWGGYGHWGHYAPYGGCSFCNGYTCFACYGGCHCFSSCHCCGGFGGFAPVNPDQVLPPPKEKKEDKKPKQEEVTARVIVELPADAKLFIDGQLMKSESARRVFVTPRLEAGKQYFYDLRAEIVRDDQTLSDRKRVFLRPGEVVTASFGDMSAATASARTDE